MCPLHHLYTNNIPAQDLLVKLNLPVEYSTRYQDQQDQQDQHDQHDPDINLNPAFFGDFGSLDNNTIAGRKVLAYMPTQRQYRMLSRVTYGFQTTGRYSFITLTSSTVGNVNTQEQTYADWIKFRHRLKRRFPFEFIWTLSLSKKKRWHIHIIARTPYIEQQWLSKTWFECHQSPIVDVQEVTSDNISGELLKNTKLTNYMLGNAKESGSEFKWGMSRHWIPLPTWRSDMRLLVMNRGYEWFVSLDGKQAYQSVLQGHKKAVEYLWQYEYVKTYSWFYKFLRVRKLALQTKIYTEKTYNPTDVFRTTVFRE